MKYAAAGPYGHLRLPPVPGDGQLRRGRRAEYAVLGG